MRVGHLEQGFADGHIFAPFNIFLQHTACDGRLDVAIGDLVVELCLLRLHGQLLGIDAFHLGGDALTLLLQARVVAANLFLGGGKLFLQHLDLIVDVVELLAWNGTVVDQLVIALALSLGIGNLLADAGYLLLQVELLAVGRSTRGVQLLLVGF